MDDPDRLETRLSRWLGGCDGCLDDDVSHGASGGIKDQLSCENVSGTRHRFSQFCDEQKHQKS